MKFTGKKREQLYSLSEGESLPPLLRLGRQISFHVPYTMNTNTAAAAAQTIIYSKSLTNEKTEKWNNKFLGLTMQSEKEKQRK